MHDDPPTMNEINRILSTCRRSGNYVQAANALESDPDLKTFFQSRGIGDGWKEAQVSFPAPVLTLKVRTQSGMWSVGLDTTIDDVQGMTSFVLDEYSAVPLSRVPRPPVPMVASLMQLNTNSFPFTPSSVHNHPSAKIDDILAREFVFAVDIETEGQRPRKNNIVSIGTAWGSLSGLTPPTKMRVSVQPTQDKDFEKRCFDEFWSRPEQSAQLKVFRQEAINPRAAMERFMAENDMVECAAAKVNGNAHVTSDNPLFDIGFLDYNMDIHLDRTSLAYSTAGKYRGVADEWEVLRIVATRNQLGIRQITPETRDQIASFVRTRGTHDHYPENDAECIYWRTVALARMLLFEPIPGSPSLS